jgi:hypothetical protein
MLDDGKTYNFKILKRIHFLKKILFVFLVNVKTDPKLTIIILFSEMLKEILSEKIKY